MSAFVEYTTSAAFHLDLSSNMIAALFLVDRITGKDNPNTWEAETLRQACSLSKDASRTMQCLERRGLVTVPPQYYNGGLIPFCSWKVTREGKAVLRLLKLAGFEGSR